MLEDLFVDGAQVWVPGMTDKYGSSKVPVRHSPRGPHEKSIEA